MSEEKILARLETKSPTSCVSALVTKAVLKVYSLWEGPLEESV